VLVGVVNTTVVITGATTGVELDVLVFMLVLEVVVLLLKVVGILVLEDCVLLFILVVL
jgi:hypothetical protein